MADKTNEICTLSDEDLINKADEWITKLTKTGGRKWSSTVFPNMNEDTDMIFCELINRFKIANQIINNKLLT